MPLYRPPKMRGRMLPYGGMERIYEGDPPPPEYDIPRPPTSGFPDNPNPPPMPLPNVGGIAAQPIRNWMPPQPGYPRMPDAGGGGGATPGVPDYMDPIWGGPGGGTGGPGLPPPPRQIGGDGAPTGNSQVQATGAYVPPSRRKGGIGSAAATAATFPRGGVTFAPAAGANPAPRAAIGFNEPGYWHQPPGYRQGNGQTWVQNDPGWWHQPMGIGQRQLTGEGLPLDWQRGGGGGGGGMNTGLSDANAANEARYQAILQGLQERYDRAFADLGRMTDQKRKDTDRNYNNTAGKIKQHMIDSGLTNSTVTANLLSGNEQERSAAMNRITDEDVLREIGLDMELSKDYLDFMERKHDQGPDLGMLAQLMQGAAAGGGMGPLQYPSMMGGGGGFGPGVVLNSRSSRPRSQGAQTNEQAVADIIANITRRTGAGNAGDFSDYVFSPGSGGMPPDIGNAYWNLYPSGGSAWDDEAAYWAMMGGF